MVHPIFMDTSNVKIKVLPATDESVDDLMQNAAKKQFEKLKEKYKDFKGKE